MRFYLPEDEAIENGMTHEGSVYGIPAWFDARETTDSQFAAVMKYPWMEWWATTCEFVYDQAVQVACFVTGRDDLELVSPIYVTRALT